MFGGVANNGLTHRHKSLLTGLQWYWDLDSADATITDQHSGLVLTRESTVNTLLGGAPDGGNCVDFPLGGSTNVYRNLSVAPLQSYSESYTVNIWVRNTAISATNGNWYINHRAGTSPYYFQILSARNPIDPQTVSVLMDGSGNIYRIEYPYTIMNQWFMITTVVRGHTFEMWINGTIYVSQVRVMTQSTANAPFAIGNAAWTPANNLQHQGQLFAAGVWNKALTGTDINNLYNGGKGKRYDNL